MERTQFICDGCEVVKKDANHWLVVRIGEAFHIHRWGILTEGGSDGSIKPLHFCGHACVQKKLSEWMGKGA